MLSKTWFVLIVLVTPVLVSAQATDHTIHTKIELVSALCRPSQDRQSREILLNSHPELITKELLTDLNGLAAAFYRLSPEQSFAVYEVAIQVAVKLNDPKLIATTYYNSGRVYSASDQFLKAVDVYQQSLRYFEQAQLRRDVIYVLSDLGATYFILEDYEKAKAYSERSIRLADELKDLNVPASVLPENYGRARALQTLADINRRDGDHSQAIERLQTSLALYQQLSHTDSSYNFFIAGDLMALGRVHTEAGDNVRALSYLNQAVEIVKTLNDLDMMASLRNSIGVLYTEQEDYAQAKAQFDQSLKTYTGEKNTREAARVLLNLGVIEQRQEHYDEALTNFQSSLQAAQATRSIDIAIAATEGIGVVLTGKKDFVGAVQRFNQGITAAKENGNLTRQTELIWRSAQVYYDIGDFNESASLAKDAVALAHLSHSPKLLYLATTTLGESYAAQKNVGLAILTLKQAVKEIEELRVQVGGRDEERQHFFENGIAPYHALVNLLIQQGQPAEALMYAERAKGRVLLDVLSEDRFDVAKVLTTVEKERSQRLNRNIFDINEEIEREAASKSVSLDALYVRLETARLEAQSFQDALFAAHPQTRIRSGHTDTLDSLGIESLALDGDCAYLEYVVTKDHVSLFVLTKGKTTNKLELNFYPLTMTPKELAQKVDRFHDRLANQHPDYPDDARDLYSLLVAPAADHLKGVGTLCIIPDGFLWNLPFQALMSSSDRFLLEDHAISYVPSLSVLREMSRKESSRRNANSLIAFGNPVIGKDEQRQADLCPLPEAENEVGSIAKTAGLETKRVFIGRDASEKTFKTLAPGFSVIHLATHGVLDNRNPLYSHLLLTRTEGDVENDGLLEAREIMDMRLDADLAVLSACETANGKIAPGEGVMGMSWAFFVAGCRSMLVSQWKVNSSSTSQLMVNFYKHSDFIRLRSGSSKAKALRAAALQLMKDDRYSHPFFWAGFVLIGVNQTQ